MKHLLIMILTVTLMIGLTACDTATTQETSSESLSTITVTYYHSDENAESLLKETANISELTAEALVELLIEKNVLSEGIAVNSCTTKDNIIYLDLNENFQTSIQSTGTAGELLTINGLTNTFLDAFDAKGLKLSVEGNVLETGHNIYDFTLTYSEE